MSPRISVFMPCHNKPAGFAIEGIQSCLDQDFPDWELWILENSQNASTRPGVEGFLREHCDDERIHYRPVELDDEFRAQYDVPVKLCNEYYPVAQGDFILYMSDDDLWLPGIFSKIVESMDANPGWLGMYFQSWVGNAMTPGERGGAPWIGATHPRGCDQLDSQIDGGQMAFRRHVLKHPSKPRFPEARDPAAMSHSDGIFMERLAQAGVVFQPVDYPGLLHRRTPYSNYTRL